MLSSLMLELLNHEKGLYKSKPYRVHLENISGYWSWVLHVKKEERTNIFWQQHRAEIPPPKSSCWKHLIQQNGFLKSIYKLLQMLIILSWHCFRFKRDLLLAFAGWLSEKDNSLHKAERLCKNLWAVWEEFHLPRNQLEHPEVECLYLN